MSTFNLPIQRGSTQRPIAVRKRRASEDVPLAPASKPMTKPATSPTLKNFETQEDGENQVVSDWVDSEDMMDDDLPTMNEKADVANKRLKVENSAAMSPPLPVYSDIVQPLTGKKTVLVTGGAGFIGYHVADLLLKRGDDVVIIGKSYDSVVHLGKQVVTLATLLMSQKM